MRNKIGDYRCSSNIGNTIFLSSVRKAVLDTLTTLRNAFKVIRNK